MSKYSQFDSCCQGAHAPWCAKSDGVVVEVEHGPSGWYYIRNLDSPKAPGVRAVQVGTYRLVRIPDAAR